MHRRHTRVSLSYNYEIQNAHFFLFNTFAIYSNKKHTHLPLETICDLRV